MRIDHVRLRVVPWFFRLPWFRRFDGYALHGTILVRSAAASEDLVTHVALSAGRCSTAAGNAAQLPPDRLCRKPVRAAGSCRSGGDQAGIDASGSYTGVMALRGLTAALLSFAVPGAGQLYAGKRLRGVVLLVLTGLFCAGSLLLVTARPFDAVDAAVRRETLVAFLAVNLLVLALRLFAVVDAWRWGARAPAGVAAALGLAVLVSLTLFPHAAAAWYAVRGYETLTTVFAEEEPRDVFPAVNIFLSDPPPDALSSHATALRRPGSAASAEATPYRGRVLRLGQSGPGTVVPGRGRVEHPWVTMLLVGSDHGPERAGHRPTR